MTGYILFHQFKHHLQYIKQWIEKYSGNLSHGNILTIKTLGSSQLDMYCGSLSVEEILGEISKHLHAEAITNLQEYKQWVGDGFKLCQLSDGSCFTLRFIEGEKPVHIHPARHVPHSIRIKVNAIKTIVCYMLVHGKNHHLNIAALNELRKLYLQLPPVAATAGIEEMEKVLRLLT